MGEQYKQPQLASQQLPNPSSYESTPQYYLGFGPNQKVAKKNNERYWTSEEIAAIKAAKQNKKMKSKYYNDRAIVKRAKQKKVANFTTTEDICSQDFTADISITPIVPPVQSLQQPEHLTFNPKTIGNKGKKNKKNNKTVVQQVQVFNVYNPGQSTRQFQAPHQDEPEDLTDDLAPNMAGQKQQPTAPARPATAENKLNFKFQRTTQQKTTDWLEFQNKFKRIGGASPDPEPTETTLEVKQEPNNQSTNTGSNAAARQLTATTTQETQKPAVTPKTEMRKTAAKSTEIPLNTINVRARTNYPLPKMSGFHTNSPGYPSFPSGIPRSFLAENLQRMQEKTPPPIPPPSPAELDFPTSSTYMDLPSWILPAQALEPETPTIYGDLNLEANTQMFGQQERPYSPTDIYSEVQTEEEPRAGSESPEHLQGHKRPSAFSRLGPLTQPKKPKLTINLQVHRDQAVREVVNESEESPRYVPVHLRKDILESEDEIVKKYLPFWPWKKNLPVRKTVSARVSKSAMLLEQEQMEAGYEKDNLFIQVAVRGYPSHWTKEDVLDAILECLKGKSFIPLFVDFSPQKCKFLVIRCHAALLAIHKVGFCIRKDDVELTLSISLTDTRLNQIDLIPRLVLRRRLTLMSAAAPHPQVDLTSFLAEKDVSNFVYFPLNRPTNQMELFQLQSAISWEFLTDLNLSHNRLSSIDGFSLHKNTPRLKRLDLSHNHLDRVTLLIPLRDLPLRSLKLEGNPLCHDYIDSAHYVHVVRLMFSEVMELDGVRITLKGDLPAMKRNYCPSAAAPIVEKFLETFFPLLEAPHDDRAAIEDLYDKNAVMTITFRYALRYGTAYRYFRNLFLHARSFEEGDSDSVHGASSIAALVGKWPQLEHDRYAMYVDVIHHDDLTTILRVSGVLKLTAKSLAEDEHLLTFARTVVLHTRTGTEYKIHHEMLYWDVPREEVMRTAFNVTTVRRKQLSIKLESPPDEELKSKLTDIFVKLADLDKKRSARCLEIKNWDLRSALEYYISLLKLGDLAPLAESKISTPVPQAS